MVSKAPHNPTYDEVDEPTLPYSRSEIDRLRQVAKLENPPPQEQRLDAERPEITHVTARGMLTVVPEDADEDAGDQGMEGWFELDGRWRRVCVRSFEHFGLSGAPPGMVGAVDTSFVAGTIDLEGSAPFHLGPQLLEVEQAEVAQAYAPELEAEDSQPFSRRYKWKLWVLVASPLALALVAWGFARAAAGPEQPVTRDAEQQVKADVPGSGSPTKAEPPVPTSSVEPKEKIVPSEPEPPIKPKERKGFAESEECDQRRKSAKSAKESGSWEEVLVLAKLRNCWSPASKATVLQLEALFELGRYSECVQLGAQAGSKKEIKKWLNTCQSNL